MKSFIFTEHKTEVDNHCDNPVRYLTQCRERTSGCIWMGSASYAVSLLFIAGCSGMKKKHFQRAHSHIDGT